MVSQITIPYTGNSFWRVDKFNNMKIQIILNLIILLMGLSNLILFISFHLVVSLVSFLVIMPMWILSCFIVYMNWRSIYENR